MSKSFWKLLKLIGTSLTFCLSSPSFSLAQNPQSNSKKSPEIIKIKKLNFGSQKNSDTLYLSQTEQITVKEVIVVGNTVFSQENLDQITQTLEGRNVTISEIESIAQKITELYLNEGYILSRGFVIPDQDFANGIVQIGVVEGSLEDIVIVGESRLKTYVRSRVELAAGKPLNYRKLEERLRLLKEDPLIESIEAVLREGSQLGQNILEVKITDARQFVGNTGFDNYGIPSTGAVRFNLNLGYRNIVGLGDNLFISYSPRVETFTGTYNLDFNYDIPVNAMDGKVQLKALIERNEIIEPPFDALNITGRSEYYEINYRQPIIRELTRELALSFGLSYREGQTFIFNTPTPFGFGPDDNGISKTNVLRFGQEYFLRESSGAWGFRSQFRLGVGIFDVTSNPSPIPDGYFFSWLGQIQRLQVIDENNILIMQLDAQLTPDALLPSEQFTIGGGQSVRGYRQNALTADNGIRLSIENRMSLIKNEKGIPVFQLAPFVDMGGVWNTSSNPNSLSQNQTFIIGVGLGVLWQPVDGFLLRVDYAPPIISLSRNEDNIQDYGLYFNLNYQF